jgi:hypothetical protein
VTAVLDLLRLAGATFLVLLPGRLVARALGQQSLAAALAWAFAALFGAWAVVFALHGSIRWVVVLLAAVGVAALVLGRRRPLRRPEPLRGAVALAGAVLGVALWRCEGAVIGDGLFHEGRVRKLLDLGGLHLRTVDEFKDGGLHPGYAFPLWHGFLAVVSWVSGLDPEVVIRREPSVLVPVACVLAWEAGTAVFGWAWGGVGVALVQVGLFCLAPGNGGSYTSLALPATASRQLFAPAAIALWFFWLERSRRATLLALATAFGALTLIHPTYALFLLVPLAAAAVLRPQEWRRSAAALVAALLPTGAVVLWLKPVVDETVTRGTKAATLAKDLRHYRGEVVTMNEHHFRLAAQVLGRTGAISVAALALVPLCALAWRRRWPAFALGGTVAVLALMLVPWLFVHLTQAVSLSQARRAAGFTPLPFALVGGLALAARSWLALPASLVAGIVLQREWPGDFAYGLRHGGPAAVTWWALIGGTVALVAALVLRPGVRERWGRGAVAVALLVAPVAVHGLAHWSPAHPNDPLALPPATVRELRTVVPPRAVLIGPQEASYRAVAAAPVYAVSLPVEHVADTTANDLAQRVPAVRRWLTTHDPAIARRWGATWAIAKDGTLTKLSASGSLATP